MRFLVIDDSIEDVALLRSALASLGQVEITPIANGHAASELLADGESCPFDLIVIDWRLPGIAGDQLAKAFLTGPAIQRMVPVVVLSSRLPAPVNNGLHECGALVLEKPVDLDGYDRLAEELCDLAKRSKAGSAAAD